MRLLDEQSRPAFDDKDIEELRILVRLAIEFHDFLKSTQSWPKLSDDGSGSTSHLIDSILFNVDSFQSVMNIYAILVGATKSTIDWESFSVQDIRERFLSSYRLFLEEEKFETKCRLLLDLMKIQIVFAGAYYDSI